MSAMDAYREFTGKSVEEALKTAREDFGVGLDDLDFEILTPGSRGVLGMGAEPARILAAPRSLLGGSAPKREAAASKPLPRPAAPDRDDDRGRGDRPSFGDRDRGPRRDGDRDRGPRRDDRGGYGDRPPRRDDRSGYGDRGPGPDARPAGSGAPARPAAGSMAGEGEQPPYSERPPRRDDRGYGDHGPRRDGPREGRGGAGLSETEEAE